MGDAASRVAGGLGSLGVNIDPTSKEGRQNLLGGATLGANSWMVPLARKAADKLKPPKVPGLPDQAPALPDASDEAIKAAKLMERRRQLGLVGQGQTWLTGARGDTTQPPTLTATLLGS